MLAKIIRARKDGKSSFKSLVDYVRTEINEQTGEIVGRGEVWVADSILNKDTVSSEMKLVVAQNSRVKNPAFHAVLTWQTGEKPSASQWQDCVTSTLDALGFSEHQAIAVAHENTGNFHVHIVTNRVHPDSYKAHYPAWAQMELHKQMRILEQRHGFEMDHGLYVWDKSAGAPVKTPRSLLEKWREERGGTGHVAQGDAVAREVFSGVESLQAYVAEAPQKALRQMFKSESASWQQIHQVCSAYGLKLCAGEKGGFAFAAVQNFSLRVKASDAMRSVFAGKENRARLAQLLGPFEPAAPDQAEAQKPISRYEPHRPAQRQRDDGKRELRAARRAELFEEYRRYKQSAPPPKYPAPEIARKRSAEITQWAKSERKRINKEIPAGAARQVLTSRLEMKAAQLREGLRLDTKRQKDEARAAAKTLTWGDWVEQRAGEGNAAALSALRGMRYRKKRKQIEDETKGQNCIGPGIPGLDYAPILPNLSCTVDKSTGTVIYRLGDMAKITDTGRQIFLNNEACDQSDAIRAALMLAREKFGQSITLTGSLEFKKRVVSELCKMQPPLDLRFADPYLERNRSDLMLHIANVRKKMSQPAHTQAGLDSVKRSNRPRKGNDLGL